MDVSSETPRISLETPSPDFYIFIGDHKLLIGDPQILIGPLLKINTANFHQIFFLQNRNLILTKLKIKSSVYKISFELLWVFHTI